MNTPTLTASHTADDAANESTGRYADEIRLRGIREEARCYRLSWAKWTRLVVVETSGEEVANG